VIGNFASSDGRAAPECELAGGVSDRWLGLLSAAAAHAAKNNKNSELRKTTLLSTPVFWELLAPEQNL